ncbi:hypothetical protein [Sphingomonas sp. KR3-1]|uniref:hypothetical protein n=1 Tax=Sphingomonas sp. KR3-1 TaxID=3156611 RepID=UPI0032B40552
MTSLLEARGSDAIDDAPRGPALWEARQTVAARLVNPLLVTLVLAPFWGVALWMLRNPHPEAMRMRLSIGGVDVPLDAEGALEAYYAFIIVLLSFTLPPMVSAVLRAWRMRYRVDGLAIETWRGATLVRRIPLAEIRSVAVDAALAWMRVRVGRSRRGGIEMRLRADDAARLLAVLDGLGIEEDDVVEPIGIAELAADEPVRWQGRPGFAALNMFQLVAAPALFLPVLIYVLALQWSWDSGFPFKASLFLSAIWTMLLGGLVMISLVGFSDMLRGWIRAAFGTVLVTDRRIAWRVPFSDRIYREIALAKLVDAVIVERKRTRAWVALTVRKKTDVRAEDLRGIPDADGFLAALGLAAR